MRVAALLFLLGCVLICPAQQPVASPSAVQMYVRGRVVAKLPQGTLVEPGAYAQSEAAKALGIDPADVATIQSRNIKSRILIKGLPNEKELIDGEGLAAVVVRSGSIPRPAANGATATVAVYTFVKAAVQPTPIVTQ